MCVQAFLQHGQLKNAVAVYSSWSRWNFGQEQVSEEQELNLMCSEQMRSFRLQGEDFSPGEYF